MPQRRESLWLHEEVLLLALRDDKGTIASDSMYQYGLGGALLAELLLAGSIVIEGDKKKVVRVANDRPLREPLLDECLEKIAAAKRSATLQTWVQRVAQLKNLRHRVALGLCERGILRADEDTVLLIFRRKIYPEINPRPERELIERLRKAIFGDSVKVDPRTIVLLSLAHGVGLLAIPFDKKSLKARKERLSQLVTGEPTGAATCQAVEAARAAAAAAAVCIAACGATCG